MSDTSVESLMAYAGIFSEMAAKVTALAQKQHAYINGGEQDDLLTEGGTVPTLAKQARITSELIASALQDVASQMAGAMTYVSPEVGVTKVAEGGYFSVKSTTQYNYLDLYRRLNGAAVWVDDYPNGRANRLAMEKADGALSLTVPASYQDQMPWVIGDKFRNAILGIKANGYVHALLDTLPGSACMGEYAWAICDANKVVLLGVKWTGEVVAFGLNNSQVTAYASGPVGGQDIFVLVGDAPHQITSSGCNFSPVVRDGKVSFIQQNGAVVTLQVDLPITGMVAPFVRKFAHLLSFGQSLSTGSGSAAVTLQAPVANRLYTLNAGVFLTNQDDTLTPAMVAPFKPMVAARTETSCVQLAAQLNRIRAIPADTALVVSAHGRGGYTIQQLSKGSLYYSNMMTAITHAKAECDRLGYEYSVPFLHFRQGEADRLAAPGYYTGMLLQLQADFEADVNAITGRADRIPLLLEQLSNVTSYAGVTSSNVVFEQYQVSVDYPDRFVLCGPGYAIEHSADGTHMKGPEYQRLGVNNARAAEGVLKKTGFIPTSALYAKRTGAKVVIDFHVPYPPLVLDRFNVTDPGNLGFRWVDSTNSAQVTGVRLIGSTTVELSLSNVPSGENAYVGIGDIGFSGAAGGPRTGMRSNLRDSSTDVDGFGVPTYNWAVHQRVSVVAA